MAVRARAEVTLITAAAIQSVTRYYKLVASTASAPTSPSTSWDTTEPTITASNIDYSLYQADLTTLTDGTTMWGAISKSASWQAAVMAYNKAVTAGNTATEAASAAQEVLDQFEATQFGGRNLLQGTSDQSKSATGETLIGTAVIGTVPTRTVTFRVYGYTVSGDWHTELRVTKSVELGDEFTVGDSTLGEGTASSEGMIFTSESMTDEGWLTLTCDLPETVAEVAVWIVPETSGGTVYYHSPKLELGPFASQWTMTPEEFDANLQAAVQANEVYKSETEAKISELEGKIALRVAKTDYDKNLEAINGKIGEMELTESNIAASVKSLDDKYGSFLNLDLEGLHLTQANSNYELVMKSDELHFRRTDVANADPVATFGVNGVTADRLRSLKELSVGTEDDGWFDFVSLNTGMAEKWRNVTGASEPFNILRHPVNTTSQTASATLTVEASGSGLSYVWQSSIDEGVTWTNISGATSTSYTVSLATAGSPLRLYRCQITHSSGVKASQAARASTVAGPVCNAVTRKGSVLTAHTFGTVTGYQWYYRDQNGAWAAISGATAATYTVPGTPKYAYCCQVTNGSVYNASPELIYL